jgi:IclR family pca regulon transcriptional regulator
MAGPGPRGRPDSASSIAKGLQIIQAFNDRVPRMNATEMARCTGMTRTAARRHLLALRELGFVDSDDKDYWLTPRVLRLGWGYFDSARLPRLVLPYLQRVTGLLNEVALCGVLDGDEVVYIARNGLPGTALGFVPGSRVPAVLSSAGIAMLASWPAARFDSWLEGCPLVRHTPHTITTRETIRALVEQARRDGHAVLEQQLEPGVRGIAVPLRNRHGEVVAGLSVSSRIEAECTAAATQRVVPVLEEVAHQLRNLL